MTWIKRCTYLMLALSIVLAGFPGQAAFACPMMKMQASHAGQDSAPDCHMAAKVKTNKCCTDPECDAKCSALSSGTSIDLPFTRTALPIRDGKSLRLSATADALVSQPPATQERPPRILA